MNPLVGAFAWLPVSGWERLAADALWQSTALAGAGLLAGWLVRRRAALRAAVLLAAAILSIAVPALSSLVRASGGGLLSAPAASLQFAALPAPIRIAVPTIEPALTEGVSSAPPARAEVEFPAVVREAGTTGERILAWLALGWLTLSMLLALRLARGWFGLRGAIRSAEPCSDPAIRAALSRAAQTIAIRSPQVLTSEAFDTPALAGLLRPRLLVPSEMPEGVDWFAIFCHELAHLARRDGASRLAVELCLVALPWQPLLWLVRRQFRSACEEACDDWAVSCGADPIELASLLVELVPQRQPAMALGMAESPAATRRRVLRLLAMKGAVRAQLGLALGILGWILAVGLGVTLALLQSRRPTPPPLAAPYRPPVAGPNSAGSGYAGFTTTPNNGEVAGVFYDYSHTPAKAADGSPAPPPWGDEPLSEAVAKAAAALPKSAGHPPAYVIESPDVLLVDAVKLVPKAPYHVEPLDVLQVQIANGLVDQPNTPSCPVDPSGKIDLGAAYGKVQVAGQTVEEAQETIVKHLSSILREPQVSVTLGQTSGQQQIAGEHLVGPDGTVNIGSYGTVYVAGMTVAQATQAIEKQLSSYLEQPRVSVDVFAYNSKVYYLIVQGGAGDSVTRSPLTGNDTVLDTLAQQTKLPNLSDCWIWIARPGGQVLPVDWQKVVEGTDTTSNWRITAGDRIFIRRRSAQPTATSKPEGPPLGSLPPGGRAAPTYTYTVPFQTYQYNPGPSPKADQQSDSASEKKIELLTELLESRVHAREELKQQVAVARSNLRVLEPKKGESPDLDDIIESMSKQVKVLEGQLDYAKSEVKATALELSKLKANAAKTQAGSGTARRAAGSRAKTQYAVTRTQVPAANRQRPRSPGSGPNPSVMKSESSVAVPVEDIKSLFPDEPDSAETADRDLTETADSAPAP